MECFLVFLLFHNALYGWLGYTLSIFFVERLMVIVVLMGIVFYVETFAFGGIYGYCLCTKKIFSSDDSMQCFIIVIVTNSSIFSGIYSEIWVYVVWTTQCVVGVAFSSFEPFIHGKGNIFTLSYWNFASRPLRDENKLRAIWEVGV